MTRPRMHPFDVFTNNADLRLFEHRNGTKDGLTLQDNGCDFGVGNVQRTSHLSWGVTFVLSES